MSQIKFVYHIKKRMTNYNKFIVNIDNLKCNISLFKRMLNDGVKLCAVVKANAYGVGVKEVCMAIYKYVDYFAVSNVFEALEIRSIGVETDILILGSTPISEVQCCADNNITVSVDNIDYIKSVCANLHSTLKIHLKVNTGLNRYGVKDIKIFKNCISLINKCPNLKLEGIFTHFATKKEDLNFLNIQKNIFEQFCYEAPKNVVRHCASSFATILSSTNQYDMVRVGINMYGDLREDNLPLKNVIEIKSQVVAINELKKHQSVGYDRTFIANKYTKIAVVPLGYADGIDRRLSNKGDVLINGCRANIVGNICMDSFMVDVTNIDNVYIGTPVTIVGCDGCESVDIPQISKLCKTSPYDILLGFRYNRCEYVSVSK